MNQNEFFDSRHHRVPRARNGSNEPPNTVRVNHKKHEAYHILFGIMTPTEIAELLTETWIDPQYKMVAVLVKDEPFY